MGSGGPNQAICRKEAENGGGVLGRSAAEIASEGEENCVPFFCRPCVPSVAQHVQGHLCLMSCSCSARGQCQETKSMPWTV